MIRFLPFILLPILVFAGLMFWRFNESKKILESPKITQDQSGAVEVPKSLPPGASLEDRVKVLEEAILVVAKKLNPAAPAASQVDSSLDTRLKAVESALTDLKVKVSNLEKATPAPQASTSKSTVYIPLGSGGKWGDKDWYTTQEYEVSLNPSNYPGYTGMVLEVTFKLGEAVGTGSVRLYNTTDGSALSSQVDTTSSNFSLKASSPFTLPSGAKNYKLQVKSTQGAELYIQSARVKVNF